MDGRNYDDNDERAPDYSGVRANARLELHEAVCAERYASILAALERAVIQAASLHVRLDVVSTRMWLAVSSTAGAAIAALFALGFYIMTKK